MFTPSTANAADIAALRDTLNKTLVGEVCTYDALSHAIGRDIQRAMFLVLRAIRTLNKENGSLFAAVHRVGYKRMASKDAHMFGSTTRARIRRTAHRTSAMIAAACERANEMPDAERRKAMAEIGILNMVAHLSTERAIASHSADTPQPVAVSMREMLRQMEGKS